MMTSKEEIAKQKGIKLGKKEKKKNLSFSKEQIDDALDRINEIVELKIKLDEIDEDNLDPTEDTPDIVQHNIDASETEFKDEFGMDYGEFRDLHEQGLIKVKKTSTRKKSENKVEKPGELKDQYEIKNYSGKLDLDHIDDDGNRIYTGAFAVSDNGVLFNFDSAGLIAGLNHEETNFDMSNFITKMDVMLGKDGEVLADVWVTLNKGEDPNDMIKDIDETLLKYFDNDDGKLRSEKVFQELLDKYLKDFTKDDKYTEVDNGAWKKFYKLTEDIDEFENFANMSPESKAKKMWEKIVKDLPKLEESKPKEEPKKEPETKSKLSLDDQYLKLVEEREQLILDYEKTKELGKSSDTTKKKYEIYHRISDIDDEIKELAKQRIEENKNGGKVKVKTHTRITESGKSTIVHEHERENREKKWVPPTTMKSSYNTPEEARGLLQEYKKEAEELKKLATSLGGKEAAKSNPEFVKRRQANLERQRKYFELTKKFQQEKGVGKFAGEGKSEEPKKEEPKKEEPKEPEVSDEIKQIREQRAKNKKDMDEFKVPDGKMLVAKMKSDSVSDIENALGKKIFNMVTMNSPGIQTVTILPEFSQKALDILKDKYIGSSLEEFKLNAGIEFEEPEVNPREILLYKGSYENYEKSLTNPYTADPNRLKLENDISKMKNLMIDDMKIRKMSLQQSIEHMSTNIKNLESNIKSNDPKFQYAPSKLAWEDLVLKKATEEAKSYEPTQEPKKEKKSTKSYTPLEVENVLNSLINFHTIEKAIDPKELLKGQDKTHLEDAIRLANYNIPKTDSLGSKNYYNAIIEEAQRRIESLDKAKTTREENKLKKEPKVSPADAYTKAKLSKEIIDAKLALKEATREKKETAINFWNQKLKKLFEVAKQKEYETQETNKKKAIAHEDAMEYARKILKKWDDKEKGE